MTEIAIAARAVSKRFGATEALRQATIEVGAGKIVGLVGENGAGKSTLIRILGGVHRPDSGDLELFGRLVRFRDPQHAIDAGIATIPQDLRIAPALSIAENVLLGALPWRRWAGALPVLDRRALADRSRKILLSLGLDVDPARRAGALGHAERQLVAIARALSRDARILILDEPTASLEDREVERLFSILRSLRDRGVAIVYVSHRLDELDRIADRCVVMRDGQVVANLARSAFERGIIVGHMTGRMIAEQARGAAVAAGAPILETAVAGERLSLCSREIVGLAGLLGSGAGGLLRQLFGAAPPALDSVLHGRSIAIRSPGDAVGRRIALVSGERQLSLIAGMSVRDNIVLPHLALFRSRYGRNERAIDAAVSRLVELVDIRPPDGRRPVRELSGGNQQKVIFARWLLSQFDVLLLDEPTQGIDVAAKVQIHRLILEFAGKGGSVLLSTSDMIELTALADRIYAMRRGRLNGQLRRDGAFDESAMRQMLAGAQA